MFQPRGTLRRAGEGRPVKGGFPRPQSHRLPVDVSPGCDIRSCTRRDTIGLSVQRGQRATISQAVDKKVGSPAAVQESGFPKLYIGFLPVTATKEELAKRFRRYGSIVECFIVPPRNGESYSYGFVKYDSVFSSLAAIHMLNGTQWDDCKICVKWSHTRKSNCHSIPELKQKHGPELPPYSVCVKRIPLNTSEEMLRRLFSAVGTVKDVCIVKLKPLQETLYGFVQFSTLDEAQRAISHFNNFIIDPQCKQSIKVEMPYGKRHSPLLSYDELLMKRLQKLSVPVFAQAGVDECTAEITGSNCQLHDQPVIPRQVMDSWNRMVPPCPANILSAIRTTDLLLATSTTTAVGLQFSSTSGGQSDIEAAPGLTSTEESGTTSDCQQALAHADELVNTSNQCTEPCCRVEALLMSLKELPTLHSPISSPEPSHEQEDIPPLESVESPDQLTHTQENDSGNSHSEGAVSSKQYSGLEANIEEGPLTLSGKELPTFYPPTSPGPSSEQESIPPLENTESSPPLTHTQESDSSDSHSESAVSKQCSSSNSSGPSTLSGKELPTLHSPISSPEPSTKQDGIPPLESVESLAHTQESDSYSEDEKEFQKGRCGRSTQEIEKNIALQQRNIHRFQTELKRLLAKNEAIETELRTEELGVTLPSEEIPPDILWEYDQVIDLHGQIAVEKCRQKLSKRNFDELLLKAEQMLARDKLALMEVRLEVEAEEWLAKLRLAKLENRYLQTKADLLT